MQSELVRSELLIGAEAIKKLSQSKVIIFGIGGVGGYALEIIARSGVGYITIVDADKVEMSNINRQILALHSTIEKQKIEVALERIKDINPNCKTKGFHQFYLPENADFIDISQYDYVVDCIDTMVAKAELIKRCSEQKVPLISSMGAGNRTDATALYITDIYKTQDDPLAKVIRKKCREMGIKQLKVVASKEKPQKIKENIIASNAYVPAAMGIIIGGEVIKCLINN